VAYVEAVKARSDGRVYVHVYSNGILATRERLATLRDAGVDEIRFDITARDYDTAAVGLARELIPTVTVEIPAVPEDEVRLPGVLRELDAIGVDHLNLHQIHVSPDNAAVLSERGYTFLHQPLIVVMESELAALRTLDAAMQAGLRLPVNYCCPNYKGRWQRRARRARAARLIRTGTEEVTAAGYLRRLTLRDTPENLRPLARELRTRAHDGASPTSIEVDDDGARLSLTLDDLGGLELGEAKLSVTYTDVTLAGGDSSGRDDGIVGPRPDRATPDGEMGGIFAAGSADEWSNVEGVTSMPLRARRDRAAEATFATATVRDTFLEMLARGWDERRAFACIRSADAESALDIKTVLGDWSKVRQLRTGEVCDSGLGDIC
jgi:hypothetical protein